MEGFGVEEEVEGFGLLAVEEGTGSGGRVEVAARYSLVSWIRSISSSFSEMYSVLEGSLASASLTWRRGRMVSG